MEKKPDSHPRSLFGFVGQYSALHFFLAKKKKKKIQSKQKPVCLISASLQMYHKHEAATWNSVSIPLYIVHVSSLSTQSLMCAFCVISVWIVRKKKKWLSEERHLPKNYNEDAVLLGVSYDIFSIHVPPSKGGHKFYMSFILLQ